MNTQQRSYYSEMLHRGRLVPFTRNGKLMCFITYCLGDDEHIFTADHWKVMSDNPRGSICYITQLITDKHQSNPQLSYRIWHDFKAYIKHRHPSVQTIKWRRWNRKKGVINVYCQAII